MRSPSRNVRGWAGWVLPLALCESAFGAQNDDFESYPLDQFPPVPWFDAGQVAPDPSTPDPSAVVVETTDAFGNTTRAVSIVEAVTTSQSLYQELPVGDRYRMSADVCIDGFSDGAVFPLSNWAVAVGVAAQTAKNPAFTPQVVIYASGLTESWRLLAFGPGDAEIDLGIAALVGTWYRVGLELDVDSGQVRSRIWDIAAEELILDRTDSPMDWDPDSASSTCS